MEVTSVNTFLGWNNGERTVTKYITEHFENGQSVTKTERRSYDVFLYTEQGKIEQYPTAGQKVDLLT
jgi:hypothetical protein